MAVDTRWKIRVHEAGIDSSLKVCVVENICSLSIQFPTGRGKQTHQSALPFPLLFTVEAMAVSRVNRKGSFSEEEREGDREEFREMKLWRK